MKARPILMAAVALAGCAPTIPERSQLATASNPAWRTAATATVPIDARWWERFGDPALNELVNAALAGNSDLEVAAARVREARAQERLARAQLFPTLDVGGGVTEARSVSPLGTPSTATGAQPLFQGSYEIDLFGRIDQQISAARSAFLASEAARDAAALSVASAAASGYITLRALDARLLVARDTLAARAEALRIAEARARTGYTSQLELSQAQAEYRATAQIIPQAELAISRQENGLSLLTGRSPGAIRRGLDLSRLTPPPIPDGLPSDLLRRRPDIAQAELTLAASDATLAAARAQFLPSLRLTGSSGLALSTALADPITLWSVGASILAPIFRGGALQAGFETAASRRDQAAFGYQRIVLTAFREVEDALAGTQRIAEQRRELEAQRAALAEALRHATNRYQAGYSPYLEQLDAQRNLLAADLSLVQLRADELTNLIALYQAMGGGWSAAAVMDR